MVSEETGTRPSPGGDVVASIQLPARPALLLAVQRELSKPAPHLDRVAELVHRDAAISGYLLQTANSAFFRTTQPVRGVREAVTLIGMEQCAAIIGGILARRALASGRGLMMARFWDVSEKRARGLAFLARAMRTVPPELAYSFGLFCDIGIPLLKQRFADYGDTLKLANQRAASAFLQTEEERHGVTHAKVGALLAERWGLSAHVTRAIATHHHPEVLYESSSPATVRALIATNLLVERAIQAHRGEEVSLEWDAGGPVAAEALGLSEWEVEDVTGQLRERFADGA